MVAVTLFVVVPLEIVTVAPVWKLVPFIVTTTGALFVADEGVISVKVGLVPAALMIKAFNLVADVPSIF